VATHDLVVIGGGPGGSVAAIRAAQLGLDTACIETEPRLGGTCLRIGCIPSKALLESSELYHEAHSGLGAHGVQVEGVSLDLRAMMARKTDVVSGLAKGLDGIFRKHKITRYLGYGRLQGPGRIAVTMEKETASIEAKTILLATGSKPAVLRGVELDGERIGTSTEALAYDAVPEHLVVIGAGAIGLELGSVWARLGARVTVLEALDRILPGMDREIATEAKRVFEKQGLAFRLGVRVKGAAKKGSGCAVEIEGQDPLSCDRVLVAIGRVPNTDGLGLESLEIATDDKGFIPVDEKFATRVPGVYAIGDVIGGPMLAHKAEEEGVACVEWIVRGYGHVDYDAIPNVVYTAPEVASVGRTEEELSAAGVAFRKGSFPFLANARARVLGRTEGRVKILAAEGTDRVLGVHVLGARAGDLIAEAAAAIAFGASAEDIARTPHAHPSLAEAMKEAALAVDQRPLHI